MLTIIRLSSLAKALLLPLTLYAQTAVAPAGSGTSAHPYQIDSLPNLYWLSQTSTAWASNIVQTADIDASATSSWSGGFPSIGNMSTFFSGSYNGNGHAIQQLRIISSDLYAGLFGVTEQSSTIKDLGLTSATVTLNNSNVTGGILVGLNRGTITGCYATGTDSATSSSGNPTVGGLVGENDNTIRNSYTAVTVFSSTSYNVAEAGGLVGTNYGIMDMMLDEITPATISNSYTTGTTTAITTSYNASAQAYAGGLVGVDGSGEISKCYAMGKAQASAPNSNNSTPTVMGALIGENHTSTALTSYWNTTAGGNKACGLGTCNGAIGLDSASMFQSANFASFNFDSLWYQHDGHTTPLLRTLLTPLTITAKDTTKTYDGNSFSGDNGITYSQPIVLQTYGTLTVTGSSQGAKTPGTYAITPRGLYPASQHSYLISYAPGTLTIHPKTLTLTGVTANDKVYDATTQATLAGTADFDLSAVVGSAMDGPENVSLAGIATASFANKNVGTNKAITIAGLSLAGADQGNYSLNTATLTASITARPVAITGVTASNKTYDGTPTATLSGGTLNAIAGDDATLVKGSGIFADKNVGTAKIITPSGYAIIGADAGNYALSQPTITADILARNLTIQSIAANNKVYDATTSTTLSGIFVDTLANEFVTLAADSVFFVDPNVGKGKYVIATGFKIVGGSDAANYQLTPGQKTFTTANITPYPITVTADAKSITQGDSNVPLTYTATPLLATDTWAGELARIAGDTAGTYAINQGTLDAGLNYAVTFVGADYTINAQPSVALLPIRNKGLQGFSIAHQSGDVLDVTYNTPFAGNVSIDFYSLRGQKMLTVNCGMQNAGAYSANVQTNTMPVGLYTAMLRVDGIKLSTVEFITRN